MFRFEIPLAETHQFFHTLVADFIRGSFHLASAGAQGRRFNRLKFSRRRRFHSRKALLEFGIGFFLETPGRFQRRVQGKRAVEFGQGFPI